MAQVVIDSSPPPTNDGNGDGWLIETGDIKRWKNKDRDSFLEAVRLSQETGIGTGLYPHLARLIRAWPYPYDPSRAESYGEVDGYALEEAITRISAAFQGNRNGA